MGHMCGWQQLPSGDDRNEVIILTFMEQFFIFSHFSPSVYCSTLQAVSCLVCWLCAGNTSGGSELTSGRALEAVCRLSGGLKLSRQTVPYPRVGQRLQISMETPQAFNSMDNTGSNKSSRQLTAMPCNQFGYHIPGTNCVARPRVSPRCCLLLPTTYSWSPTSALRILGLQCGHRIFVLDVVRKIKMDGCRDFYKAFFQNTGC